MTEFARLAATPCTDHAALGVLLARELGRPEGAWVGGRLQALARRLPESDDPAIELHELGKLIERRLRIRRGGALLLPDVVAVGAGHPAGVAVVATGIAARAGFPVGLVGNGRRLYPTRSSTARSWSIPRGRGGCSTRAASAAS